MSHVAQEPCSNSVSREPCNLVSRSRVAQEPCSSLVSREPCSSVSREHCNSVSTSLVAQFQKGHTAQFIKNLIAHKAK